MKLAILGTRGIPAKHGGFETFAEHLALYLVARGWEVTVYCPAVGAYRISETDWQGVRLLHIPVSRDDALGTISFDWKSILHASRQGISALNLGYGTAIFYFLFRFSSVFAITNMDGIEWRREKWSFAERAWLYANERLACWFSNHLIADHPEIRNHLMTRVSGDKITMIPYGADLVEHADAELLKKYDLLPGSYALIVARPDPDNSIIEIVRAFSARPRGIKLVVLGRYTPESVSYHSEVISAAGSEVVFTGGIYDVKIVESLRCFARLYIHGHRVGGTNPSLVEALAAGSPVLAHDNPFNRWVVGEGAAYFNDQDECEQHLDRLLEDPEALSKMKQMSQKRHLERFTWDRVLREYEVLLGAWQQ